MWVHNNMGCLENNLTNSQSLKFIIGVRDILLAYPSENNVRP